MFWSELSRFGRGWDALREMENLRSEMNRLFTRSSLGIVPSFPAINIWVQDMEALVTAELPGIDVKDLDISVIGETLTLSGNRKSDELQEGEAYHRQERGSGPFTRTVNLPFKIEADRVSAGYEKGVLRITLPRAEEDKPKKIQIKSK